MNKIQITIIVLFLGFFLFWFFSFSQNKMGEFYSAQLINSTRRTIILPQKQKIPRLNINAEAAASIQVYPSGREVVIFQKGIGKGLPIASLTKLMTAIVTLENYDNLDRVITISKEAAEQENAYWGGNLKVNQKRSIQELLKLMLIYSSNDSAFALSEIMGEEKFVEKMNQKAEEIKLSNTRFINATGLDPQNGELPSYSTIKDLVRITKYILKNHPSIFEISLGSRERKLNNSLSGLNLKEEQKLIGGKTGFTYEAGGCLLTVFKNEKNHIFINIVLGAKSNEERIKEMQKIINWINLLQ